MPVANVLSSAAIQQAESHWGQISEALWGLLSPLKKVLGWYATDLHAVLIEELRTANQDLVALGYEGVWDKAITELSRTTRTTPALIDSLLLREVLRNLLRNVIHTFAGLQLAPGEHWSSRVRVSLTEIERREHEVLKLETSDIGEDEADKFHYLTVDSTGNTYRNDKSLDRLSTLSQHQQNVASLGGHLNIRSQPDGLPPGTRATLALHTRYRVFRNLHSKSFTFEKGPATP